MPCHRKRPCSSLPWTSPSTYSRKKTFLSSLAKIVADTSKKKVILSLYFTSPRLPLLSIYLYVQFLLSYVQYMYLLFSKTRCMYVCVVRSRPNNSSEFLLNYLWPLRTGMRRPSWNKSQAIQQVISLKTLLETTSDSDAGTRKKLYIPRPENLQRVRLLSLLFFVFSFLSFLDFLL